MRRHALAGDLALVEDLQRLAARPAAFQHVVLLGEDDAVDVDIDRGDVHADLARHCVGDGRLHVVATSRSLWP